ncbi:biliverdin-producing heme oxygenase [Variovorax sp. KK3]|uniref:biliverdin-producing heme oxygenase n=1 Tax=Variovorax sp. KK3 TaxID=1855728 RepID=UPI00097C4DAA|nr:biliverdin-producing heme oxygenase [Variovorax sp. KK3]
MSDTPNPAAQSPAAPGTDVLQALRTATSELHERLDSRLPLARDDASLQDYVKHLRVLRPWLIDLRQALAGQGAELDAVTRHMDAKLADLDLDLAQAGAPADADAPARGGPAEHGPGTSAYAWGLAYVVEGSQLGGVVLHKRLRERLAPHALRYLGAGEDPGVAARWREFTQRLRGAVADKAAVQQAQRGAVAAFEDLLGRFGV